MTLIRRKAKVTENPRDSVRESKKLPVKKRRQRRLQLRTRGSKENKNSRGRERKHIKKKKQ